MTTNRSFLWCVSRYVLIVVTATSVAACDYLGLGPSDPPPSSMVLLPGFRHELNKCMDTRCGRIWKFGGPEVGYEVRGGANLQTLPETISVKTMTVGEDELTIVRQSGNRLGIAFQDVRFEATNVRTQQDIDDILQMVKTYSSPTWPEIRELIKQGKVKK